MSGHTGYGTQGALEGHPFTRAPMAEIASEGDEVAAASGSEPVAGIGPAEEPRASSRPREAKRWDRYMVKWDNFVVTTCFVCCGVELQDIEPARRARVRGDQAVIPRRSRTRDVVLGREGSDMRGEANVAPLRRTTGNGAVAPSGGGVVSAALSSEGSVFLSRESYLMRDPEAMMSGAIPVGEARGERR